MSGKDNGKNKKIIGIVAAVLVVIAIIVFLIFFVKSGYRVIKISDFFGKVNYDRGNQIDMEVFEGLSMQSGDTMRTGDNGSYVSMMLDSDKYVCLEENSEATFEATGRKNRTLTEIKLSNGAVLNEINNKLGEKETYEVNTPNATMSVRGTRFRVSYYLGSDGIYYTRLSVFEGVVESHLIYPDGKVSVESHSADEGNEILIYYDEATGVTDFVKSDEKGRYTDKPDGKVVTPIRYYQLPRQIIEILYSRTQQDGVVYAAISADELKELLDNPEAGTYEELLIEYEGEAEEEKEEADQPVATPTPTVEPTPVVTPEPSRNQAQNTAGRTSVAPAAPVVAPTPTPTPVASDDDSSSSDSGSSDSGSSDTPTDAPTPDAPTPTDPPAIGQAYTWGQNGPDVNPAGNTIEYNDDHMAVGDDIFDYGSTDSTFLRAYDKANDEMYLATNDTGNWVKQDKLPVTTVTGMSVPAKGPRGEDITYELTPEGGNNYNVLTTDGRTIGTAFITPRGSEAEDIIISIDYDGTTSEFVPIGFGIGSSYFGWEQ